MTTVSVLAGPERRRRWSVEEKIRIVEECRASGMTTSEVARRHGVHRNQLHWWQRQMRTGVLSLREADGDRFVPVAVSGGPMAAATGGCGGGMTSVEVLLRNGRVLRVPDGVAVERAASLATALEGCVR
jgi:transposase